MSKQALTLLLSFGSLSLSGCFSGPDLVHDCPMAACAVPNFGVPLPGSGETDVPRDARIWIPAYALEKPLSLTDSSGNPIATTSSTFSSPTWGNTITVLTPQAPLDAGETYTVVGMMDPHGLPFTFTVGSSFTGPPPSPPQSVLTNVESDSTCLNFTGTFSVNHSGYVLVMDSTGSPDPNPLTGTLSVSDLEIAGPLPSNETSTNGPAPWSTFYVGRGDCFNNAPTANAGATVPVRFGLYDVSGQFSGWSDVQNVQF